MIALISPSFDFLTTLARSIYRKLLIAFVIRLDGIDFGHPYVELLALADLLLPVGRNRVEESLSRH